MPPRRLSAEESTLWARVAATVRPMVGKVRPPLPVDPRIESVAAKPRPAPDSLPLRADKAKLAPPTDTLDGGWDRRLRRGIISPDRTIDLHGHTLATARDALDHALARAVADEVRVLLVITGRPPKGDEKRRGLIRASIGDWLGQSGYSNRIAAVRNAHPRHGGAGALYLIMRRKRG